MGSNIFTIIGIVLLFNEGVTGQLTISSATTASVAENSAAGTTVLTLTVTGENGTVTYAIDGGSDEFSIATDKLQVKADATLDFETTPTYTLTITATDEAVPTPETATATVTVSITDVNEAPAFNAASFTACVGLNSPAGTPVLTVTATDEDTGDVISYSLTGGNDGGIFAISPATGAITVETGETVPETPNSYSLEVTATDDDTTPLSETTTVTVTVGNPCPGTGNSATVVKDQLYLAIFCVAVAVLKFFSM